MERIKALMNIMPEQLRRTQITTSTVSVDRHGVKQMPTRVKAKGGNRLVRKLLNDFLPAGLPHSESLSIATLRRSRQKIVSSNTHEQDCVCWSSGCNLKSLQGPLANPVRKFLRLSHQTVRRATKPYGVRVQSRMRAVVMRTGRNRAAAAAADAEAVYNHDAQCP